MNKAELGEQEAGAYRVAAASSDGIVVNQHFGRAGTFYIYEMTKAGKYRLLETRTATPVCSGGGHDEKRLYENIRKFWDCRYMLVSRAGAGAANALERSGITPVELPGIIEESLEQLLTYEQLQNLF